MHSRVFQLSDTPIKEEEYISEDTFYEESFIGTVADYVSEIEDRGDDIDWLLSTIEPHGVIFDKKEESIIFTRGFKQNYFKGRFEEFQRITEEMTLQKFAESGMDVYRLKTLIEDKFAFYIYQGYPQPMDDFVRYLEEDTKYYIGGIIDYHA